MYHNYSNDELLRELETVNSDCPLVKELVNRLFEFEDCEETINGKNDDDYTKACVSNMQELAGEDIHQEVIEEIRRLETIKKMVDRKEHIDYIVNKISDMDREALELIEAVKVDGVFL